MLHSFKSLSSLNRILSNFKRNTTDASIYDNIEIDYACLN